MPRKVFGFACATVLAVSLSGVATAHAKNAASSRALAEARAATAVYHDLSAAIDDGFVAASECVAVPGLGTMGVHFVNFGRMSDPGVDVSAPEELLYTDSGRLIGLEYYRTDADQNLATDSDRPSLFGVPFDGPMLGHGGGMPIHYDLHVWTWQANPLGMFAPFNPNVSC